MMAGMAAWIPAGLLSLGAVLTYGGMHEQLRMPLEAPLETAVPAVINQFPSRDLPVSPEEQAVAGMDDYVMRIYAPEGAVASAAAFSVYVGYYQKQSQGHSIHSPKNCLPGAGWEPLTQGTAMVPIGGESVTVNRYLIGNGDAKALVLYWYQGRGRVAANEYLVKWQLLRDQAIHGRSDEALVRIIVPVTDTEDAALEQALQVAQELVPAVSDALPT